VFDIRYSPFFFFSPELEPVTKICVPILCHTTAEARAEMARLAPLADLFELRLDAMYECDLVRLLADRPRPVIVTNRPAVEGGFRTQDESIRLANLSVAVRLGADYVDVELTSLPAFERFMPPSLRGPVQLIVSYHNFSGLPDDLRAIARTIEATSANVVKVAVTPRRLEDNLRIFDLLRAASKPTIALAMGEFGQMSRILAGKFGALLTFAAAESGHESAPGQITADEMVNLYRAGRINPATKVYALIGNPVEHSLSPAIHNAAFAALDLDAVYLRLKVEGDPAEVVRAFADLPIDGYSVTIPHKAAVIPACSEIDPVARRMKAVNTLVRRDDGYHATNTDVTAAMQALAAALRTDDFSARRAVVVGAGGVGRAYVHGLIKLGAAVSVADLDQARCQALAAESGATPIALTAVADTQADILMNATPIGMWPNVDAIPVDPAALRPGMVVFDAVYNPRETRLLREAAAAGCLVISGVEQFIGQAVEQFELWTARQAPAKLMRKVVLNALANA
jgi:3-dehydroquinate dehydratase/shikimate dehydrogenase